MQPQICRLIDTIYSMRRGHIIHCKRTAVFQMRPGTQARTSSLACISDSGHQAEIGECLRDKSMWPTRHGHLARYSQKFDN